MRNFSRARDVFLARAKQLRRYQMPVLLLWAVPAVIVVGGVGYYLVRAVN
jgi:hypothetical protein